LLTSARGAKLLKKRNTPRSQALAPPAGRDLGREKRKGHIDKEIMLFIGKPKGTSKMISNRTHTHSTVQ